MHGTLPPRPLYVFVVRYLGTGGILSCLFKRRELHVVATDLISVGIDRISIDISLDEANSVRVDE
jgi:hypothetical protein